MGFKDSLRAYYRLTKPGIIYGNAITAIAGFLLAAKGNVGLGLLAASVGGISLVIGSACVFNNYLDRDIDQRMARTKKRVLVTGQVSSRSAIFYATLLGLGGFLILGLYANLITVVIGLIAITFYVILYGIAKRRTVHSTLVGSVPGAASIVAGYTSVTGRFDREALILFLILVFWQMPHFYAIAMYRFKDYKAAKLPVLPVRSGFLATKIQILVYVVAFVAATVALKLFGYTGYPYLVVVGAVGLAWLWRAVQGFRTTDDKRWARQMFFFSLVVTLTLSFMLATNELWAKL